MKSRNQRAEQGRQPERLASRLRTSRSQVYARALAEFVIPGNVLLKAKHTRLDRESVANVSQLVTVDKRQLTERVGQNPRRQMEAIFSGIDLVMGR